MKNVYIEPQPTGRPEGEPISHFTLEFALGISVDKKKYLTQKEAIDAAKRLGHKPLVARVRHTDKGKPDHWRSAE